jgi:molybdenum cofactor cytidylyltransferase
MQVAALVLAAGGSKRLGQPKQLVRIKSETLLERAVRIAQDAGCSPVVVVVGAAAAVIQAECDLGDSIVVVNGDWVEGMGSSIRVGVGALRDVDACVVMTCDMPAVTAAHLRMLMVSGETTASEYAGRPGVPAYFPMSVFPSLLQLQGDSGARDLLRTAKTVELVGGELDVDTTADLERLRELFG